MSKATILVVEDDHNLIQGIRDILELQEYRVITAGDGASGLNVMHDCEPPPDLIVSDIMMPEMNGYEFFEAVRNESRWTSIPFIFLTAKGEKSDVRAGKSMGADDYVIKPFDTDDLLIAIDAKLRRRKELEQVRDNEVSSVKKAILTILNHEFRTPLTYVVAYSDMLHRDADDLSFDEIKSFLNGVNSGADRLRRLVENFILLVELETGEARRNFDWRKYETNDINDILVQATRQARFFADVKQVNLQLDLPAEPLPHMIIDQEYLKIAVARLIDNGIKFSANPDSTVWITASADHQGACISVTDEGRGIPPEQLDLIFDTFYQIDRERYEDQGAGAGLPIVKGIAELHGGKVVVHSIVGQGSQFVIWLPPINN